MDFININPEHLRTASGEPIYQILLGSKSKTHDYAIVFFLEPLDDERKTVFNAKYFQDWERVCFTDSPHATPEDFLKAEGAVLAMPLEDAILQFIQKLVTKLGIPPVGNAVVECFIAVFKRKREYVAGSAKPGLN